MARSARAIFIKTVFVAITRSRACQCVRRSPARETSVFGPSRLSAPRSSWSTSTRGCGSRRGKRACSCTRGRTPGCWRRRRPCRRCGSCGSGTPCGKRCGGELEASGKGESGGREILVRRVVAPVRRGDLFVGGCLEDGRAGLFFVFGHVCACVRGSGAVRVRRALSRGAFSGETMFSRTPPSTDSSKSITVENATTCTLPSANPLARSLRRRRHTPSGVSDDRARWLRRPAATVTAS